MSHKFRDAYERLSKEGKCDMAGGMEYQRVLEEWLTLECPTPIDDFIVTRANAIHQSVFADGPLTNAVKAGKLTSVRAVGKLRNAN